MTDLTFTGRTVPKVVPTILVIGGGYAGTLAANRLQQNPGIAITLVNARPKFVQRVRLHQVAAGTADAITDYGTLIGDGVQLVVDSATRIDTAARQVLLASGRALDYDYLIYAVGSTGAVPDAIPGAVEFAYPVAELEQAQRLRAALGGAHPHAPVTVVGAGLTGLETAAELAEQGHTVTLACGGRLAPTFAEPARRAVANWLGNNGVHVRESAVVTEVRPDAVVFGDGTVQPSAVTVWAGGFGVPDLAANSGLRTDPLGRLRTDETLTSIDDHRVVGAGDAVVSSALPLRMSGYITAPTGATAADTVLSRIAGTQPARLRLAYAGSNVALGRRAAVVQLARSDDTPVNFHLRGRVPALLKEAACRIALWGLRREARKPGVTVWYQGRMRSGQPVPEPEEVRSP